MGVLDQWWRPEREVPAAYITQGDLVQVNGVWYEVDVRYTNSDGNVHIQSKPLNASPPQIDVDIDPREMMLVRKLRVPVTA